ncbi:SMI1/KNR4 family protein [Schumannella sp. 10F1B-5-1]|uniref:SMI1/KNR4 family protein n=1 Tax=Schumannella sp. 10F1B-5-1 TaxID=2590780 RepID=UPI0011308DAE|nr:SMI1/KNR4 family protein [Schumannella sp. 10F1B-5-1]TPW70942.1 SMI1/KNR4 family protein [Schumannella sp. 10F1B-5-1]
MGHILDSGRVIDAGLRRAQAEVLLNAWNEGISAEQVARTLDSRGFPRTPALEQLWAWHNGFDPDLTPLIGQSWIMPGFFLLSAEEAIEYYDELNSFGRWNDGWLPVLADGAGDFVFLDYYVEGPPARRYYNDEDEQPFIHRDLEHLLGTIAAGFESGVIHRGPRGSLEMDHEQFDALAKRLNPGVPWWD